MTGTSKTFSYTQNGLSFTVTINQNASAQFVANITLVQGSMDVNAIYFGDDTFSGPSSSLPGP